MTWLQDLHDPQARDEATYIVKEFAGAKGHIEIGGVADAHGGVAFMYAEGQLLAREQYLEPIREVLGERAQAEILKRVIRDIVLLKITFTENGGKSANSDDPASAGNGGTPEGSDRPAGENDGTPEREPPALLRLLDEIDAALGPGIATLDHVLTAAQGSIHPCPATEPQEVYDPKPYPPQCPDGGEGVRVFVADTGVFFNTVGTYSWLGGVSPSSAPDPRIASDGSGRILPYGGHGTFVAGVIGCLAPGAKILVKNVFNRAGSRLESDFVPDLHEGFRYGAEIFHLTVASPTRHHLPLIAFEAWMQDLHRHKGVVCVVAAGNSNSRHPFWPGAFRGMVSVGALASDWRSRAYFSNYGGWVDVYAPGQNLVNAFATGPYRCHVHPYAGDVRHFSGMAQWSGTSFSSPIVTGLIAARMTRCGESAKEAAEALLAEARAQAIPGVGAVLFPCCDDANQGCGRGGDKGRHCGCGRGHGHGACGCDNDCGGGCGHGADCGCEARRRRLPSASADGGPRVRWRRSL